MKYINDKITLNYNYTSRYGKFPVYYNRKDGRYVYGRTSHLKIGNDEFEYQVKPGDTFDSIALAAYGRPDLFWIVADYNRITDCFIDIYKNYKTLILPNLLTIEFID